MFAVSRCFPADARPPHPLAGKLSVLFENSLSFKKTRAESPHSPPLLHFSNCLWSSAVKFCFQAKKWASRQSWAVPPNTSCPADALNHVEICWRVSRLQIHCSTKIALRSWAAAQIYASNIVCFQVHIVNSHFRGVESTENLKPFSTHILFTKTILSFVF